MGTIAHVEFLTSVQMILSGGWMSNLVSLALYSESLFSSFSTLYTKYLTSCTLILYVMLYLMLQSRDH